MRDLHKVFKLFGFSRIVVTNRGKQFVSEVLRQHNIKLRNTTPYSPWVYGESE